MRVRIDPARVRLLIGYSKVTAPFDREARQSQVDAFLRRLWDDAMPEARSAFESWRRSVPAEQLPWAAVTAPAIGGPPPALLLIRGQAGDPDAPGIRGDVIELGTPAWESLRVALETWDTVTIARWMGPIGWRMPLRRPPREGVEGHGEQAPEKPSEPAPPPKRAATTVPMNKLLVGGALGTVALGSLFYVVGRRT